MNRLQKLPENKLIEVLDFVKSLQNTKLIQTHKRPLGLLKNKLKVHFAKDFKITDEDQGHRIKICTVMDRITKKSEYKP